MSALLETYLTMPSPETLELLKFALQLTVLLHLPFFGFLLGSSILSVFFSIFGSADKRPYWNQYARDLINTFAPNKGVVFALAVAPVPIYILIYSQILYGFENASTLWFALQFALSFLGCLFLYIYKHSFDLSSWNKWIHHYSGVLGVLFLLGAGYQYFAATSLLLYPEKWNFIYNPGYVMFASVAMLRFGIFLHVSMAMTVVASKWWFFNRARLGDEEIIEGYKKFVIYVGGGIAIALLFPVPVVNLIEVMLVPSFTTDEVGIGHYFGSAIIVMIAGQFVISALWNGTTRLAGVTLIVFFAFFVNYTLLDYNTREFALQHYTDLLEYRYGEKVAQEEAEAAALAAEAEAVEAEGMGGTMASEASSTDSQPSPGGFTMAQVKAGKKLYQVQGCASCHSVDGSRIVGPSFKNLWNQKHVVVEDGQEIEVVTDLAYITKSIKYPNSQIVKGYPAAMAAYNNLTDAQIEAIAAYLASISEYTEDVPAVSGSEPSEQSDEAADTPTPAMNDMKGDAPMKLGRAAAEPVEENGVVFTASDVKLGKKLYQTQACASCHSVDGSRIVGPSFKGLWGLEHVVIEDGREITVVTDMEYLANSIRKPNSQIVKDYPAAMPAKNLTDAQVKAIAAYIASLSE